MEEAILRHTFIDNIGIQQRQDASEAIAGDKQFGGNNLVAQADGLTNKVR